MLLTWIKNIDLLRKSHNAPFCNRNVHMCAHFCCKIVHCGIFVWCIVGICGMGLLWMSFSFRRPLPFQTISGISDRKMVWHEIKVNHKIHFDYSRNTVMCIVTNTLYNHFREMSGWAVPFHLWYVISCDTSWPEYRIACYCFLFLFSFFAIAITPLQSCIEHMNCVYDISWVRVWESWWIPTPSPGYNIWLKYVIH